MRLNAHIRYPIIIVEHVWAVPNRRRCDHAGTGAAPSPWGGDWFHIMATTHSEEFRRRASECRRRADEVAVAKDKRAWLKLADDWGKLARGEELMQEWLHARSSRSAKCKKGSARNNQKKRRFDLR